MEVMITIKKILTLKPRLQVRKCGELCYLIAKGKEELDSEYVKGLESILLSSCLINEADKIYIQDSFKKLGEGKLLSGEDIYYKCLEILGEEVADWDFVNEDGVLDSSKRTIFPHYLFLDRIRSPFNLGSIFRSAESFGIKHIYIRDNSAALTSPRALRTSRGAIDSVSHSIVKLEEFKTELPLFALELGGTELNSFSFPQEGIAVIGSEETGVSPELLSLCDKSLGRVSIKQYGAKGSINVSVAAGIMMHAWLN